MKTVIIITVKDRDITAIAGIYSNLKKAVQSSIGRNISRSYITIYRALEKDNYVTWEGNGLYYRLEKREVE